MDYHGRNANFLLWELVDDVRQGSFTRCKTAGLSTDDIRMLTQLQLDDVSYISSSGVSIITYQVDRVLLRALILQSRESRARRVLAERALSLGASARMMSQFFGWTGRDVARYRELAGDQAPMFSRGRPPIPSENTTRDIISRLRAASITLVTSDYEVLEIVMDIAQQTSCPLCSVWQVIDETLDTLHVSRFVQHDECWVRLSQLNFKNKEEPAIQAQVIHRGSNAPFLTSTQPQPGKGEAK